jgi:UPF0755 protein
MGRGFLTGLKIRGLTKDSLPGLAPYILTGLTVMLLLLGLIRFYCLYTKPVISLKGKPGAFIFIPTGASFNDVVQRLTKNQYLSDVDVFEWLSRRKGYTGRVRPGKYQLKDGMKNNELVNMLRAGLQVPVRVVIRPVRGPAELAGLFGRQLEPDSAEFGKYFSDPGLLKRFGESPLTVFNLFIPNTYELWWTTSAQQLLARMKRESEKFWNPSRRKKADSLKMTISQVVTLASIVERETNRNEEKSIIAGVYLNRLRIGIPLQADPTVIFAWNDFSIRRVMNHHTKINSPFNTYQKRGLPPSPICLPSVASIDAVLQARHHDFLYFCAREDLSGYHSFASNLRDHNINAKKYQAALNRLKIR